MAARREIREFDLLEYARCLLRKPEQVPYVQPADVLASELAAKKLVLKTFEEEWIPEAATCREQYEAAWFEVVGHDPDLKTPPRSSLTVCRRLRDVLIQFDIQQPTTKYILNMGRATVSGEYAVVSLAKRRREGMFVVRWRHKNAVRGVQKWREQGIDMLSYARWLHLRNHETHEPVIGVVNIGIDFDEIWYESLPNERQVRQALAFMIESIAGDQQYPSPGEYCTNCHTHACEASKLVRLT